MENKYWLCLYPGAGSDFHTNGIAREIAKGARSPGRTIVVCKSQPFAWLLYPLTYDPGCGDAAFTGGIRHEVIRNAPMQFAEVEFQPRNASDDMGATPLRRLRRPHRQVLDLESLALAYNTGY